MEEIDILNAIHDTCHCLVLDYAALACEYLFKVELIWFLLALLFIRNRNTRIIGVTLILAMIVDMCFCYSIKIVVDRPRPVELYDVDALITTFSTGSFPSGHTTGAFCAATVVFVFDKVKGAWLYLLAIFIGFTRMYSYAHFPTDVLAGAVLGIVCAMAVFFTYHRSTWKTVFVEKESVED